MILTQDEKLKYENGITEIRTFLLGKLPSIKDSIAVKWFDERTEKRASLLLNPIKEPPLSKTTWEIDDNISLYYDDVKYNFKIPNENTPQYERDYSILNFETNNTVGLSLMYHWKDLKLSLLGQIQEQKDIINVLKDFTV